MARSKSFEADMEQAARSIADELRQPVETLPKGVFVVLRALANAYYQAGARDARVRAGDGALASDDADKTPITSIHGRRRRIQSA